MLQCLLRANTLEWHGERELDDVLLLFFVVQMKLSGRKTQINFAFAP